MKKLFGIMVVTMMVLALVACGEKANEGEKLQDSASTSSETSSSSLTLQSSSSEAVSSAKDGTLTIKKADVAVVVNGTSVPMPYKLKDLEAAGVPADETRDGKELAVGDIFSANIYLDENEDYVLIPAYNNIGNNAVSMMEAEAEEITMTTYADNPVDQGVSILGVSFGMAKSSVIALLGTPSSDDGSYAEWHIEIPEMNYEGTLSMYFTNDADDAGVSQVNLNVFAK